ncbi:hypothetical protein V5F79_01285 [Xanthobacter flavus]|uniref:hypothetical protein n=1 Tax=Xanthobacter flavus TaxID=281 RepID=UPI00372ABDBA
MKRPLIVKLTNDERFLLCVALRTWEDRWRDARLKLKAGKESTGEADRKIADCRNLRMRLHRIARTAA